MSSFVKILMSVPDSSTTMKNILQLNTSANQVDVNNLDKLIGDMVDGSQRSYTKVSTGAIQAAGSITFTGAPVAAETLSIANVTFTARASGATGNEFNIGGTVTITATNLAAAVNASSDLSGLVSATSLAGVVTLTAVQPGKTGNGLQLSESMTNTTSSAFASGSDGTQVAVNFGAAL